MKLKMRLRKLKVATDDKAMSLGRGQTSPIFLDIYHEGTVSNWTATPVWTNSP